MTLEWKGQATGTSPSLVWWVGAGWRLQTEHLLQMPGEYSLFWALGTEPQTTAPPPPNSGEGLPMEGVSVQECRGTLEWAGILPERPQLANTRFWIRAVAGVGREDASGRRDSTGISQVSAGRALGCGQEHA